MKSLIMFLLFLIANSQAFSQDIKISGDASKVSDNGIITPFFGELYLTIDNKKFTANFFDSEDKLRSPEGSFELPYEISDKSDIKSGSKVTVKVADPNLFILSPFAGDFYLPKADSGVEFKIRLIDRRSRLYMTLAGYDSSYSVQVVTTNNEGAAIDMMNMLNASEYLSNCFVEKCLAYYEPYMRSGMPNNGYFYKVKVGFFPNKEKAEKMRDDLKKKDDQFSESFVAANVRFYQ